MFCIFVYNLHFCNAIGRYYTTDCNAQHRLSLSDKNEIDFFSNLYFNAFVCVDLCWFYISEYQNFQRK